MSSKLVLKNRKLNPVLRFRQIVATMHNNRNEDVLVMLGFPATAFSVIPTIGLVAGTPGFDKLFALIPAFTMTVGLKFLFALRKKTCEKIKHKVHTTNANSFVLFHKGSNAYITTKKFSTTKPNPYFNVDSKLVNWDVFTTASRRQKKNLLEAISVYTNALDDHKKALSLKTSLNTAEKADVFFDEDINASRQELVNSSMKHVKDALDVAAIKLGDVVASIMYPKDLQPAVSADEIAFEISMLADKASILAAERDFL